MNDALKGAMVGKLAVVGRRWRGEGARPGESPRVRGMLPGVDGRWSADLVAAGYMKVTQLILLSYGQGGVGRKGRRHEGSAGC